MLATLFYVLAGWALVSIPAGLLAARTVRWAQADADEAVAVRPDPLDCAPIGAGELPS